MASFNVTSLLSSVDQIGENYVATAYQALANAATSGDSTSVGGLLLTLYVIFWGIGIWQGTASGGPADHAFRLFRVRLPGYMDGDFTLLNPPQLLVQRAGGFQIRLQFR